jgi:hypothetical protein
MNTRTSHLGPFALYAGALFASCSLGIGAAAANAGQALSYNRDIRPILSDNCFYCHGPDKNHRDGKFRLDDRDSALTKKAIVPGKPEASKLIERIFTSDPEDLMPPPKTHKALNAPQKAMLKQWILEGAVYEPHWAYIVPKRPEVPRVKDAEWVRTPIDAFIREKLAAAGVSPSREADKPTLLRRLSLDLTGLPPTKEEMRRFLDNQGAEAYGLAVDDLLASPHFGERMAVPWLDAVRFADTVGFHGDQNQNVFPYRDYVIAAFNQNKPFDQFTREQLAGDLIPNPTTDQLTATCFNRLNMMTREGGAQPKEYLAKYAADRVRTVSNAWLGSTMNCCECHDHKFDPFTTKDFYSMEAFWADVKQWGVYMDYGYTPNPDLKGFSNEHPFPPEIVVDSPYLQGRERQPIYEIDQLAHDYASRHPSEYDIWSTSASEFLRQNRTGWLAVSPATEPATKPAKSSDRLELSLAAGVIAAIRVELMPQGKVKAAGRRKNSSETVEFSASLKSGKALKKLPVFYADANQKQERYSSGHAILGVQGGWVLAAGDISEPQISVYLLSKPVEAHVGDALVVTFGKAAIDDVKISISPIAPIKPLDPDWAESFEISTAGRAKERSFLLSAPAVDPSVLANARKLEQEVYECRDGKSPVMVTQAVQPRETRVLRRGNWQDEGGNIVQPMTPRFLSIADPQGRRLTRLDLANWLVSPNNPLTSRAYVNRLWKQFFGGGLCASVEDLGAQGELPSHPELLDWLAVEFRESGWDVKHIVRLIVTSSVYRQDSNLRQELRDVDPQNRLLSSQSPRRLEAEFIRDNALFAAGLLNLDLGGPSVFPYQPEGYYANIQFPNRKYIADQDDRQYRRGLYMHWQRTFVHPMLANFDAPSREDAVCTRTQSNTPQQALTLLNDPTFVEAARVLAGNAMGDDDVDDGRLDYIFRQALCRSPEPAEQRSLTTFLAEQRSYYNFHKDDADKLVHTGIAPVAAGIDESELAAWATVCRVVLNLHETITRY